MRPSEYAEKHGLSRQAVTKALREGRLPGKQVNGSWVVETGVETGNQNPSEVETWEPVTAGVETIGGSFEHFKPDDRFLERGRGVPVGGMVRISTDPSDPDNDWMVSEEVWRDRMNYRCVRHKIFGWGCTSCLSDPNSIWERGVMVR